MINVEDTQEAIRWAEMLQVWGASNLSEKCAVNLYRAYREQETLNLKLVNDLEDLTKMFLDAQDRIKKLKSEADANDKTFMQAMDRANKAEARIKEIDSGDQGKIIGRYIERIVALEGALKSLIHLIDFQKTIAQREGATNYIEVPEECRVLFGGSHEKNKERCISCGMDHQVVNGRCLGCRAGG